MESLASFSDVQRYLRLNPINSLPAGILGYAEITSSQSGLTTLTDISGLSATVNVAAGRRIKVTVYCFALSSTVATDRSDALIREGGTTLQRQLGRFTGTNAAFGVFVQWVGAPSVGVHTYKASYARLSGTGTHTWEAAAISPSFILVEDIGPA